MTHNLQIDPIRDESLIIRYIYSAFLIILLSLTIPCKAQSQSSLNDLPVSLDHYIDLLNKGSDQPDLPASVKAMYLENAFTGFYEEANNGNALAMSFVAYMIENGLHVEANLKNALEWHKAAADRGDAWSALRAAQIMETGPDDLFSDELAVVYFQKSLENAERQFSITGDDQDKEHLMWANFHMARIHFDSSINAVNYILALKYFQTAAGLGHSTSALFIGDIYKNGMGVQRDLCVAYNSYKRAVSLGNEDARQELEDISRPRECLSDKPDVWEHVPTAFFQYWSEIGSFK